MKNDLSADQANPLLLAYMGDAVIELLVRERLLSTGISKTGELNKMALKYVTAKKQSEAVECVLPYMNETEQEIYRRGKNAKSNSNPRNVTLYEYRKATGLEAVFGYNHYVGMDDRNIELFNIAYGENT